MKKLMSIILLIFLISCTGNNKTTDEKKDQIVLNNKYISIILPSDFSDSSIMTYPYRGFEIINKNTQVYGFISIKDYQGNTLSDNEIIEIIYSSSWDRFKKNWDNYLNLQNIQVTTTLLNTGTLIHDVDGNLLKYVTYKISFPQLFDIDTRQVGRYLERTLSDFDISTYFTIPEKSSEFINFNEFYGTYAISVIPPSKTGTGSYKVILSAFITINKDISDETKRFFSSINYRSSFCTYECEYEHSVEQYRNTTQKDISVLVFYKNFSNMQKEINTLPVNFWSRLKKELYDKNSNIKFFISTVSKPLTFRESEGNDYITPNVSDELWDDYFNIPVTTVNGRNSLLSSGLQSINSAFEKGLFKKGEINAILFISDTDDQSLINNNEQTSVDNVSYYADLYKKTGVLIFGLNGINDMEAGTNCDNVDNSLVMKKFYYLINGKYGNICSSYQSSYISTFLNRLFLFSSNIKTKHFPIYYLSSVFLNSTELNWLTNQGFYGTPETDSILIKPLPGKEDTITIDYYYKK